jgi:hypothetical protein
MDNQLTPNDNKPIDHSNDLSLDTLTDQNWLFIKHYLSTGDITKSYSLAGYEGTAPSNPYNVFKRLKPYIEELISLGSVSRLRLMNDLDKALAIPLVNRESLSPSEWLRIRKFASTLIPELKRDQKLSVLIVNRYGEAKGTTEEGKAINPITDSPSKDVIDIEPIG